MLRGAGVCRAIGAIAAVIVSVSFASAQDDAARLVEKFAHDAKRAEARKAEAARKAADAQRKQTPHKNKPSALRKSAEAQHAKAIARKKATETQSGEDAHVRERTGRGTEEATAEIRQLIQEAEAARMRAEKLLPQERRVATEDISPRADAEEAARQQAREAQAAEARAAQQARATAMQVAQHKRRVTALIRARRLRSARLAAHARRVAEQRQVQRARDEMKARARAEARRTREKLARVAEARRARARVQAAARAEAERALAIAMAAEQAQREADAEAERARQALLAAEAERAHRAAEQARREAETQARAEAERIQRHAEQERLEAEAQARAEAERTQRRAEQERLETEAKARAEAEQARVAEQARRETETQGDNTARDTTAVGSKALTPPRIELATGPAPSRLGVRPEPVADAGHAPRRGAEWNGQVTVLMVMAPGTYGIRRGSRTADPVLCTMDGCYISAGADFAATFKPRRKALGVGNTLGRRAGACRRQLGCIFRAVTFDFPGMLQPVDLHIFKHDRRRPQVVLADSNCRIARGELACHRPVLGDDYVMWVLPEWMADRAGPELLERALHRGLSPVRSADVYPPR